MVYETYKQAYNDLQIRRKMQDPSSVLLEDFPTMQSWWDQRILGALRLISPELDGTNLQLAFESPFEVLKKAQLTSTAGAFNPLFAYDLQSQIVQEAPTYGAFPKEPWRGPRTIGWRVKTVAHIASSVGIGENAAVPADSDATYVQVQPTLKEFAVATGLSKRLIDAASITDSISWEQEVAEFTADVFKALNKDMWVALASVEANNIEGLRNLLSSNSEKTGKALGANTIDPWLNVDRDAGASWADANALHNSNTDRDLSIALVDQLRENQEPYWKGPDKLGKKLYVTGYNTHSRWSRLEAAKQRFGTERADISVGGGISTAVGQEGGFKIASWDAVPVIRDDDTTTKTIKDLALFDLQHVQMSQLHPFSIEDSDAPFVVGVGRKRAVWYGSGEVTMDLFKAHGVLSDLK